MNANGNNHSKNIRMTEMLEALKNINVGTSRKDTKKAKAPMTRKSVKSHKFTRTTNRAKTMRNRMKAERQRTLAQKRLRAIRITEHGEYGIEELLRKLKKLEKFYDASNVEKQSDISVYASILTVALYDMFQGGFQELYEKDYPILFNSETAMTEPLEYLDELRKMLNDILDKYDTDMNENTQNELDTFVEILLEVVAKAGDEFEHIGKNKKNATVNALANIFGGLGL